MLTLYCAAIGDGRPFKVEVHKTKTVYDLKLIIKGERPNFFTGDASDLDLYVAIMDNEWMPATESIYEELTKHDGVPGYLIKTNRMNPAREVGKCLPSDLGTECIHILVVKMFKLVCVVVASEGIPFSVSIDAGDYIHDLKKLIKVEMKYKFPADKLDLYLALKDRTWIGSKSEFAQGIMKGEVCEAVKKLIQQEKKLDPADTVGDCFVENDVEKKPEIGKSQIHVLVKVPVLNDATRANFPVSESTLKRLVELAEVLDAKKLCTADLTQGDVKLNPISLKDFNFSNLGPWEINTWINTQEICRVTDFPQECFIRKEAVDIFNILKERGSYQIVLLGSAGVGKSLLLVLYAFWMAFEEKRSVLLVRRIKGEGKGIFFVYLNGDDPSNCWTVSVLSDRSMESILEKFRRNKCLCLDGFVQSEMTTFLKTFSVLATSAQYNTKQDDAPVLKRCLVPFWSHSDLQLFGEHKNMDSISIEKMYFISGGSLRYFLMDEKTAMNCIDEAFSGVDPSSPDLLKTQYGTSSMSQIDRIRMATLKCNG
ncbi:Aste57867_14728 [Aphanomyces stellatus]|nr:hypothetical protein As57867_014673 [Aphanomyces stellatus]VFT91546.1 Aste57867_14728 [Aphanomyces stellatus]